VRRAPLVRGHARPDAVQRRRVAREEVQHLVLEDLHAPQGDGARHAAAPRVAGRHARQHVGDGARREARGGAEVHEAAPLLRRRERRREGAVLAKPGGARRVRVLCVCGWHLPISAFDCPSFAYLVCKLFGAGLLCRFLSIVRE
jgi:hypothetical protein